MTTGPTPQAIETTMGEAIQYPQSAEDTMLRETGLAAAAPIVYDIKAADPQY